MRPNLKLLSEQLDKNKENIKATISDSIPTIQVSTYIVLAIYYYSSSIQLSTQTLSTECMLRYKL